MPTPPVSPFPALQVFPTSGLTFPWVEWTGSPIGYTDMQLGPDGVAYVMQMLIFWDDLPAALQQIIGYSYKDSTGPGRPVLRRVIPWQCPWANQLFCKNVSSVKGVQLRGTQLVPGGGVGPGFSINTGPWTTYQYALLTIHFWRPPYFVRSDADIFIPDPAAPATFISAEWLRYVDKHWQPETQFLSRENQAFAFVAGQGAASNTNFQGSVGQKLGHQKVTRKWYEIPEAWLFSANLDKTPTGIPASLIYMQTPTTNPVTGYVQDAQGVPGLGYRTFPIVGCVNSPIGGGIVDNSNLRIWDCFAGTLLLEGMQIIPRPLQLPPYLMGIPFLPGTEPLAQQQYDVEFHFDLFDPPRSQNQATNNPTFRGHNCAPYTGDGMWYACISQNNVDGTTKPTTPFQYADFTDLFLPVQ